MATPPSKVGELIKTERERSGLSLAKLAEVTGLSKTYLIRLENDDESNPSLEVLLRIADALDVTVADLVGHPTVRLDHDKLIIPPSLKAFADEVQLSSREIEMLASIRWRKGERPQTRERWRYIYDSLRASKMFDERH
jgi:XRE family transcriptional regulator of biofilm formation